MKYWLAPVQDGRLGHLCRIPQMLASSELIGSPTEQDTQLVARVEVNHKRLLALVGVVVVLAGVIGFKLF